MQKTQTKPGTVNYLVPWMIPDGKAVGLYELLNLDGDVNKLSPGELIQCDWDWTTENCRVVDSMGRVMALNMTDGTVIWRRVGNIGCMDTIVDDVNNRFFVNTAGGYVKCYDSVTGEKLWWWHNPDWQQSDDLRCLSY